MKSKSDHLIAPNATHPFVEKLSKHGIRFNQGFLHKIQLYSGTHVYLDVVVHSPCIASAARQKSPELCGCGLENVKEDWNYYMKTLSHHSRIQMMFPGVLSGICLNNADRSS